MYVASYNRHLSTRLLPHNVTTAEFTEWKADYEAEHDAVYVKGTGDKTTDGCTTSYYQCNRSGVFQSKGTGKRRLKSQGSSKINSHCNHTMQSVKAEVCHTHYGHQTRLVHIRLSVQDCRQTSTEGYIGQNTR